VHFSHAAGIPSLARFDRAGEILQTSDDHSGDWFVAEAASPASFIGPWINRCGQADLWSITSL